MRHFGAAIARDDARSMVSPSSLLGLGPVLLDGLPSIEVGNSSREVNVAQHAPLRKSEFGHRRFATHQTIALDVIPCSFIADVHPE